MTVTVIVETGSVVPGANSYLTATEATTRLEPRREFDTWKALDIEVQCAALVAAGRYLNEQFRWYGEARQPGVQTMQWPRTKNYDSQGALITPGTIPEEVKQAQAMLALEWANAEDGLAHRQEQSGSVKSWGADGVSVSFNNEFAADQLLMGTRYPQIELLLQSTAEWKDSAWLEERFLRPAGG